MTHNDVLRSLRYLLNVGDAALVDIIALLDGTGFRVSKTELGPFFRRPDHRNYRDCGDQFLRNFLKALASSTSRSSPQS
jgi:uncharacterized protein YehS (DUF1456 family)